MEWISVKDKLPEDDQSVLVIHKDFQMLPHKCFYEKPFFVSLESLSAICVNCTHWMPLPEPPKKL